MPPRNKKQNQRTPKEDEIVVVGKQSAYELKSPEHIALFSKVLQKFIKDGKLAIKFQETDKEEYVLAEGWKFAALSFGLIPKIGSVEKVSTGDVYHVFFKRINTRWGVKEKPFLVTNIEEEIAEMKADKTSHTKVKRLREITYRSHFMLMRIATGEQVGEGYGLCSNLELKKLEFDEYSLLSMAQTRAEVKACKNTFGFIMKFAGFSDTPAEEMEEEHLHKEKTPAPDSNASNAAVLPVEIIEALDAQLPLLTEIEQVQEYGQGLVEDEKYASLGLAKNLQFRARLQQRINQLKPATDEHGAV